MYLVFIFLMSKYQLSKKAGERYQNLSEEEKDKRRQYARERCRNLSEENKKRRKEQSKPQYGRERYKNLLIEDEDGKTFSTMQEIETS